jgi:hypothetical protein
MVVVATSGDAPTPRVAPVVVTQAGAPPPSVESALEFLARRIDGVSSVAMAPRVWAKICMGQGTIYRGSRTESQMERILTFS